MRTSYFAGLVQYLLGQVQPSPIAKVSTFAEAGAVGTDWPPYGLKLDLTDGRCVYLSFAGVASSLSAMATDRPHQFSAV